MSVCVYECVCCEYVCVGGCMYVWVYVCVYECACGCVYMSVGESVCI